jgi:hypothetical protein
MRHKHADTIIAWANGAQIQCRLGKGQWIDYRQGENPSWSDDYTYRIKPEVKPDLVRFGRATPDRVYQYGPIQTSDDNAKFVIDGETGALKSVEILK